jgi:phage N-6-adenine-methyltransferase
MMPKQKPGRSKQDYSTPDDFFNACIDRFGPFTWDLAATVNNSKCPYWITPETDSLKTAWDMPGNLWLNPPYANIEPWVNKCKQESAMGASIFVLLPASVGSDWFRWHVNGYAYVLALNPRLSFDGKNAYPKDCMLLVYRDGVHGFDVWKWK